MMKSIACAKCGQVDDWKLSIHSGFTETRRSMELPMRNTRAVAVCDYTAQELVRKVMAMDEIRMNNRTPLLQSQGMPLS